MGTYISPRKGTQQLELIPWKSFGSYKIEDNLELIAGQETALQELATGGADAQFADRLSIFFLWLWRQGLL
jgi:hypothetical protein